MGSTVIVLFGKDRGEWLDNLATEQPLRMGQALGRHN
jgi:hypothetical protein